MTEMMKADTAVASSALVGADGNALYEGGGYAGFHQHEEELRRILRPLL